MILKDKSEVVYLCKNHLLQEVVLFSLPNGDLALQDQSQDHKPIILDEEMFLDMAAAGAEHFGKVVAIEDRPEQCPNCGSTELDIESGPGERFRKVCKTCGLSGPYARDFTHAEREWNVLMKLAPDPTMSVNRNLISIDEAAQRG